jgi:hypothetical protein
MSNLDAAVMRRFSDFWDIFAIFLEFPANFEQKNPENVTSKIRDGTLFGTATFKAYINGTVRLLCLCPTQLPSLPIAIHFLGFLHYLLNSQD